MRSKRHIAGLAALVLVLGAGLEPENARASIFGEENITLVKQLTELMRIHSEVKKMAKAAQRGAEAAENTYSLYLQARAAVDEVRGYTTEKFIDDFKKDIYSTYPGLEILIERGDSRRLAHWKRSHARSPATTYEMIGAVFGDLTDPLKKKAKKGQIDTRRMEIARYEAASSLALANKANEATKAFDEDAMELYRLAADAEADQAEHLSARAQALIAVQNSHIIRLLSRRVRTDGIRGAIDFATQADRANLADSMATRADKSVGDALKPPKMMSFGR